MKTRFVNSQESEKNRRWLHVDADDKVLGRMAVRIAMALMGKDRPTWTPNTDTGAYVVVTNAEKVVLTGNKRLQKTYQRYSGYPGGQKDIPFEVMAAKHPDQVIREAVRRMLPKTILGSAMLKKLKVYAGPKHPHTYAKPEELEI
jgi:large subunit ribosomal protein L13